MKNLFLFLAISIFVFTSCATNKEYSAKVSEENQIMTTSNPDFPKEGVYDLVLEEIFTLGKDEDNSKYIFSKPILMDLDSKNNIYVLDWDGPKFFVFNNKGEYLRSFGKKGAGPGDLEIPSYFKITNDDRLIINDGRNIRTSILDLNGKYINGFIYKTFRSDISLDTDNNAYEIEYGDRSENIPDQLQFRSAPKNLIKVDPATGKNTPVGTFTGEKMKMQRMKDGGVLSVGPFNEFIWNISPKNKLYAGFADIYEFSIYDLEGKPLSKFRREFKPVISLRYKKDQKGEQFLPAFTRYSLFDTAGNFWVDLDTEDSLGTHIYDVFSEDGIYQKQVHSKYILTIFKENIVYSLIRSKKEVPYIKAFKYSLKKRSN